MNGINQEVETSLGVVNGPWQAIMLHASVCAAGGDRAERLQAVLIAPGVSASFHAVTRRICGSLFGETAPVVELHEIFTEAQGGLDYGVVCGAVRKRLAVSGEPNELWISSVMNWREVAIAELFPRARVYSYEDGMRSAIRGHRACQRRARGEVLLTKARGLINKIQTLNLLRHPINGWQMTSARRRVRKRFRGAYGFIAKALSVESGDFAVPSSMLRDSILRARESVVSAESAAGEGTQRRSVFIAQCFARLGHMPWETELELYAQALRVMIAQGDQVFWKEHPRTGSRYFEALRALPGLEGLQAFPVKAEIPVEITLCQAEWQDIRVVGVVSSSLIYLRDVFGYQCETIADAFYPHLSEEHQIMAALFARAFSTLELPRV